MVHSANFAVTQDYKELVDFYLKELPEGQIRRRTEARRSCAQSLDLSFLKGDMLDNLTISPSDKDPSKMNVHIAWTPDSAKKKAATP